MTPVSRRSARVAVVIPTYEAADTVGRALSSVHHQTYRDWVLAVVDDGSSDRDKLEQLVSAFQGPLVYVPADHRGAAAARNRAAAATESEFLAFLDADDEWLPEHLERQVAYLDDDSTLDLVHADAFVVGARGSLGLFSQYNPAAQRSDFTSLVLGQSNVLTSSVVMRRSSFDAIGGFDERLRRAHDFDLWLRLLVQGSLIGFKAEPLVKYTLKVSGLSGTLVDVERRTIEILEHVLSTYDLEGSGRDSVVEALGIAQRRLTIEQAKDALVRRQYPESRRLLRQAYREAPSIKMAFYNVACSAAPALARHIVIRRGVMRWLDQSEP